MISGSSEVGSSFKRSLKARSKILSSIVHQQIKSKLSKQDNEEEEENVRNNSKDFVISTGSQDVIVVNPQIKRLIIIPSIHIHIKRFTKYSTDQIRLHGEMERIF